MVVITEVAVDALDMPPDTKVPLLERFPLGIARQRRIRALERTTAFRRWNVADVRFLLGAGAGTPCPSGRRRPGHQAAHQRRTVTGRLHPTGHDHRAGLLMSGTPPVLRT